jgi:hypothetical protein
MRPESIAMANILLRHHKRIQGGKDFDACLIPYGQLCEQAQVPFLTHNPGPFLAEVADWCTQNGCPPLNALAVRADTRMPGDGYDRASNCSLLNWQKEAEDCINCDLYPDHL